VVKTYQIALSGTVSRLSTPFAGDESQNIPFRQLLVQSAGADAFLGNTNTVTTGTGFKVASGAAPMSIGPFETGPVKLSDFYGIGAGATLTILGVPF
jgi:hypothetical protein